ncbi:MAG: 2-hydroxychromene-2-carboxylate isomerase [Rhodospirillales bacterium]|jgi:2-hydroxychromene-2-carboxylate isomerase|nr:2-hydroxychromene-2-carboxylate isomerase [Rhodospirillales bacterium]
MPNPVEFYFDFSSPYAYFAAQQIDRLASGFEREVVWKPMLLGVALKETGAVPPVKVPLKGDYVKNDWARLARFQDLKWTMPDPFPIATVAAARAFYWIEGQDAAKARAFAWDCFLTFFGDGKDISSKDTVAAIAAKQGFTEDEVLAALEDEAVKQRLKDETAWAVEKGVFGSPFIIVDGEGFWGADRLWMVKRWLKSGGW